MFEETKDFFNTCIDQNWNAGKLRAKISPPSWIWKFYFDVQRQPLNYIIGLIDAAKCITSLGRNCGKRRLNKERAMWSSFRSYALEVDLVCVYIQTTVVSKLKRNNHNAHIPRRNSKTEVACFSYSSHLNLSLHSTTDVSK